MDEPRLDPDDTVKYRKEVLGRLRTMDKLQREYSDVDLRLKRTERDIVQMKQVLFGNPDVAKLRDGDRGGLVDLFREGRIEMKKCSKLVPFVKLLVVLSFVQIVRDVPPVIWKTLLGIFK